MRIAINTRFLRSDNTDSYKYFISETFSRIVKKNPQHEFIFIGNQLSGQENFDTGNVKFVTAGSPPRNLLLWKLWYNVKLSALLKKWKADVFLSFDGACSLATKIPQCLFVNDLSFLESNSSMKKTYSSYYKKNTPRFLQKAKTILTASEVLKQKIVSQYETEPSKITVLYAAASDMFQPISDTEKNVIKAKYAESKEYFLYYGAIHSKNNLVNLLKAFSLFKKRLQSGMKLLFVERYSGKDESFINSLKTYKYRNDVRIIDQVKEKELSRIIGSAYAMVNPSSFNDFVTPLLDSMKCNMPILVSDDPAIQEMAKDAAIYFDANNPNQIAEKMMLLYKDENLRKQLIEKANKIIPEYSWDKTTDLLWQCIERTVN